VKDIQEFTDECAKTHYLKVVNNPTPTDDCLIVINTMDGCKYKILTDSILKYAWSDIKRVLDGGEAKVLDQITRIVGYYSKVSNWNKSKLGELKDRRNGDYCCESEVVKDGLQKTEGKG
jgi:hypothetical protein